MLESVRMTEIGGMLGSVRMTEIGRNAGECENDRRNDAKMSGCENLFG
jgi:hypothetical protein